MKTNRELHEYVESFNADFIIQRNENLGIPNHFINTFDIYKYVYNPDFNFSNEEISFLVKALNDKIKQAQGEV